MRSIIQSIAIPAAVGVGLAGAAQAADIDVVANIAGSVTWTADNVYNLTAQIYVLPGATLTIEAGTLIASAATVNGSGSLAVCRGAQIFVNGTAADPVIMTSTNDDFVTWRAACNEWGNLTIMGEGFISEDDAALGNVPTCNAANVANMEGLTGGVLFNRQYGGGDDDDDSGSISYLSLRYGGRVVGQANELNGLSLGGVGRGTDIQFVEIMNNVDDGIEIWGGTVNVKNFTIWNVGDDSLDVDQGWRGKAQFGLIVQGYSVDANQGSGVGDNAIESDGAENSDWQPVTTAAAYNLTVIGQPLDGDGLTAWRDGARVQYRNCIFMDGGEALVKFDNVDGDGGSGYGFNGTLSWANVWATNFNAVPPHANDCPPGTYPVQVDGKLAEIKDSVLFRNLAGSAYTVATTVGVLAPASNNVVVTSTLEEDGPIRSLSRGELFVSTNEGKSIRNVISIDPRAQNDALTPVGTAPADGFFTAASYRGAFDGTTNWALGWTAADAYGFYDTIGSDAFCDANDGALSACPCANPGDELAGCDNAQSTGGVRLNAIAQAMGPNAATLTGTGFSTSGAPTAILLRSNSVDPSSPVVFGDGLRCVNSSPLVRLAATVAAGGTSTHVIGHGAAAGVGCFYYQIWYRNTPSTFCDSSAAYNLSSGRTLYW